jgi:hypothetical protein
MTKRNAWLSVLALLLLAGCSKQPPPPAPDTGTDEDTTNVSAKQPPAGRPYDRAKVATGMFEMIDQAPQCQTYLDQLRAAAAVPSDQPVPVEPSAILVQAHAAGCTRK